MNKRDAMIAAGKKGHQVLLFGQKVFGKYQKEITKHPNADITALRFPEDYDQLHRLTDYSLVIADYATFETEQYAGFAEQQAVFAKLMIDALDAGTCFCFVFFNEYIPRKDQYEHTTGFQDQGTMDILSRVQIGYQWLCSFSIAPKYSESTILVGVAKRQEFRDFHLKWGASHHWFSPYGEGVIDELLIAIDDTPLGFAVNARKSKILFLPFQRDFQRKQDFLNGLNCLIDSLLTYITRSLAEIPTWAQEPFFQREREIHEVRTKLETQLEEQTQALLPFEEIKSLLFQSEYSLESSLPVFFSSRLSLAVERDEKYKEDFWILDENGMRAIMVEVKSAVKGFKKGLLFAALAHRETNDLPDTFPTLLIVNCNLQAGSWKEKERPIDKQDYEIASKHHALILRVEDLVRLWYLKETRVIESQRVLDLLKNSRGWLEVTPSYVIEERK